jgi:Flp pilus assembly protein TadD
LTNYLKLCELRPEARNHNRTARVLMALGRTREAALHYRTALALSPQTVESLNNLAWLLATDPEPKSRNGAEAVQWAEQACALTGWKQHQILGTLAAAYAETGRFADAVRTAETAQRLATAAGHEGLARQIVEQLELYRSGRPPRGGGPAAP